MVDDGENDSALDELEFDLNQLCETWPDLALENLDADRLVDLDKEVATNESRQFSLDQIVNEKLMQPIETVDDGSSDEDEVSNEPMSPPSKQ